MVDVRAQNLPDATITKSGNLYTIAITGLTGTVESPRALTIEERAFGLVSLSPPTVTTTRNKLELALARAVEIVMPPGMLQDPEPIEGQPVRLRYQHLIAHMTRLARVCLETLEPSS